MESLEPRPQHRNLPFFVHYMQLVYGRFDEIPDPAAWVPPAMSDGHRGRYLWTDAWGVINFLTLWRETGDDDFLTLGSRLITAVHETLGRERDGGARLPGATDEKPLAGGLRIGKFDESGPDCDGQYLHYTVLWIFALNRFALATAQEEYNNLAIQLAEAVTPPFFKDLNNPLQGLHWKMSTDLRVPLVENEGRLDTMSMLLVLALVDSQFYQFANSAPYYDSIGGPLRDYLSKFLRLSRSRYKRSTRFDSLDAGMSLWIANWLGPHEEWAQDLLQHTTKAANTYWNGRRLGSSPHLRMAYREMGLVFGIQSIDPNQLRRPARQDELESKGLWILQFWAQHLEARTVQEHWGISLVMMATAHIPGAWLRNYLRPEPFDSYMQWLLSQHPRYRLAV
ncbi:hypothetical protein KEM52_005434 [Ascosphaera acerosa]|nr:hypothetical protein KEM52_005434 [Ascosphaera acerosa]